MEQRDVLDRHQRRRDGPAGRLFASLPWKRAEAIFNVVNTWTKTIGNHTLKWGVDLRRLRDDLLQTQTFSPRGQFKFDVNQTTIPGAKTGLRQ